MAVKFTNNAKTTLASGINNSATSITVADGSVFPSLAAGEYFYVTFDDATYNEIAKVTARSGNVLTVIRAQDNTTARAFANGSDAHLRITASLLTEIQENIAAKSANQTVYNATAASSATAYNIGIDPGVEANAMVFLDGVMQHHDTFSFSGSTLTFDAAPTDGTKIEVVVDNLINTQSSNLTVDTFTATSGQTAFTLSDAPGGEANVLAFIDGVFQNQGSFSLSSNTLTFDTGVVVGRTVTIYIVNPLNIGTPSDGTVASSALTGNLTLPGALTVGAYDVAFDSPTFVVDNSNSRVGLGTATPSVPVDIVGEGKISSHFTFADDAELRLGNSADVKFKHHNSGYGQLQNTGTLYIDAETIDLRTDNSSISSALTLSASNAATFTGSLTGTTATFTGAVTTNISEGSANSLNTQISMKHQSGSTGYHLKTIRAASSDEPDGLAFVENTTESMRIRGGKLNIGGATMSQLLNIQTASTSVAPLVEFRNTQAGAQIGMPANTNALALYTADTERMRIDSAGLIIAGPFGGNATATIAGSSSPGYTNQPGTNLLLKSGNGSGTGSSYLALFTSPAGSSGTSVNTAVERMRIDNAGLVGINEDTPTRDLHVKTAGSNNNGIVKVGGSDGTLGLEITYDQSGATSTTIVSNPTYTNANSVMKLAVDGNANADQLVLMGNGKIGIGLDSPSGMLHIRTSTDHNLEFEETGGDLRISALNNARNANIELEFAASQFSFLTGNVGIGLSSGIDGKLHVGGNAVIGDSSTTAFTSFTSGGLDVAVGSGTKALQVWDDNVTGTPRFSVLRDGNVLIGTTDTGATHASNGAYITPDGQIIGRSNGVVGYFNKRATDGKLLDFYRETTDVGAISAWSDNLAVGRINCALLFNDDINRIIPASVDSNTARDNVIDLGDPSHRFNDVWIGGGIHIGGTGDANKLDDYEEGNWTVAELTGQAGVTTNRAHYTKVGNMVTAWASIEIGTNTDTNTFNATLPFASSVNGYYLGGGGVGYHNLEEDYRDNLRPTIENAASNVFFVYDTFSPLSCANFSGHRIDFFVTYMV